ncbi:MAG TPA: hypothetical protein VFG10_15010 [Saprospiraceae bacterium]|nr:hypothetical protein [Saprospiraceae bacterium]
MKYLFILTLFCLGISADIMSQTIRTIQDPSGNDILLNKDSSFLTVINNHLMLYAIDETSNNRNILVTNGDTTFWLLHTGFDQTFSYTPFLTRKDGEILFRTGNAWYISEQTPESTELFYDNQEVNNSVEYLRIFETAAVNISGNNLLIEAKNKLSGDTIILYHNTETGNTSPFGSKLRIIEGGLPMVGPYEGTGFITSIFNSNSQEWSEVGYYRQYTSNLTLLLPLGNKEKYSLNFVAGDRVVAHFDDGSKKIYQYYEDPDSCTEITQSLFPNYTVLEYQNLKWTTYGYPLEPPLSYYNYFWKGMNQFGSVRYFVLGALGEDVEITDIRNVPDVDFIYSDYTTDSIYYYNYSNLQKGLIRYQIFNGGTKKDATSVAFDSDYKLRGYLSQIYYGKYNSQSGKIEAAAKDFLNNGKYGYLESSNGKRIEGPTDFTFLDDKIFVHSRTTEGLKLVVYDPNGIVAVGPEPKVTLGISVAPNPSSGIFNISYRNFNFPSKLTYIITTDQGTLVFKDKLFESEFEIDLTGKPSGKYNLCILSNGSKLYSTSLVLLNK